MSLIDLLDNNKYLEEFINLIKWYYDKKELYDKLKKYIGVNNEL